MPQSHGTRRRPKQSPRFARGKRDGQAQPDTSEQGPQAPAASPGDPNGTADPYGANVPYGADAPHEAGIPSGADSPYGPGPGPAPGFVEGDGAPYGPGPGPADDAGAPHEPGSGSGPVPGRGDAARQAAERFKPDRGTVVRVLTSNVTITAVCLAAVAAFLVFVPIGGEDDAEPPKIDAQGMSANEMLEMLRGSEMDPIAADAVASAKKRAYEKQQAAAKQEKAEKNSDETAKSSFDKPEPEAAVGGGGGPLPDAPAGGGNTSVSENKAIGKQMNAVKGWSGCWSALESLWTKESGWNERAQNPSSGAYGIPQSLPGTKMASAGSDWQTNARTQIAWGLNYIDARYGTPCEAWGHSQSVGWY